MSTTTNQPSGPSAFSVYASRFLAGKITPNPTQRGRTDTSQIFRPPSPSSPSHDPFLPSPSASHTLSNPHLAGSSRSHSLSPSRTEPFPGPGIDGIPDIPDDEHGSGIGVGLLFSSPEDHDGRFSGSRIKSKGKKKEREKDRVPNPYAASSSESEDEDELDLEEVHTIRRSLLNRPQPSDIPSTSKPVSERAKRGWLAHQSIFPPSSSESDDGSSEGEKVTEAESEEDDIQSRIMGRSRVMGNRRGPETGMYPRMEHDENIEDDEDGFMLSPSELYKASNALPMYASGTDLQEPLLGPDELEGGRRGTVPVRLQVYHGRFGHWEREGLRKYKDSGYLALWLTSLVGVVIGLAFVWGSTDPPPNAPSRSPPSLLPLIPLLLLLLIPTLLLPPAFLFLLKKTVRPVLLATAISIPFSLFMCGWWALGESFETGGLDDVDQSDRWWGTTGLRIGAVLLWCLAALFGRLVWKRRKRLERTVAVVELSTHLLLTHPPLLLLTPVLLGVFAVTSIPFLTLVIRLGMIGYWRHPRENTWVFHMRPYAGWLIFLVTLVWVWTWGVIRGIGRVAVAAVVGEWYFHRDDASHPPAMEITTSALHRATGTSLGSICAGALIVATVRTIGRTASELKRLTSPKSKVMGFTGPLAFLSGLAPVLSVIAGVLDQLNGYALVYVGITGEGFWPSARRAVGLAGRRKGGRLLDYTLIKLLLTLSSTALGLFTATAGYLYMTHTLSNPAYAPVAALLCGGIPFLAVRAGAAVLGDAADALFICYQIDRELGGDHSEKAKAAFAGEQPRGENAA